MTRDPNAAGTVDTIGTVETPACDPAASQVDPITAEIIRGALVSITDEMKTNLMRTAYNLIIYEAQDFTVGLFDATGETISIGLGLPMFVGGLSDAVKAKLEFYGPDGIEPGDIILTNDPDIMGSHLNHMIFTMPIFVDGVLVAFASSMAHWIDVGGVLGATTTDIYSEGIQVPIVKIFKRGEQNDELTRLIADNVRFSDLAMGDFRAQVAAIRTGESRMVALCRRYGTGAVLASIREMYDRSETLARQAVAAIPDGTYTAEACMDDDGVDIGRPVPIKVSVVVSGDRMTIDLGEVSPQVAGYFNSGITAGRSAAQVAFKCLTSPGLFPINAGSFRPVIVDLPPGRVISASKPAAMRWWMTYPMTVVDCVFRALADVIPGGGIAGHHADLAITNLYGVDHRTGSFYMLFGGPQGGGWGATPDKDGESATICVNDGDTHNTPVEAVEAKHPGQIIERYSLRPDSGGPGRRRGGLGTEVVFRTFTPGRLNSFLERSHQAPWGLAGGRDAAPNGIAVQRHDGTTETFPNAKLDGFALGEGDAYTVSTGGGGGYGDPRDRPVDEVLTDVRAGYVGIDSAKHDYGVVVRPGTRPREYDVDAESTHRERSRMRVDGVEPPENRVVRPPEH
ncbi:hydantoinase B/oxoprolinase family protein [Streptomyces sp. NBC_00005]|uniref:hydantoinase B/oxoprolinase family protein n=1 Tax=Streptomyces sp. NBC_00005 TaxID=2903609 RepID=UPI0032485F09